MVALPRPIEPMRAVSAHALPPEDDAWAYEVKWDGYRILAFVEAGAVRLQTRNLLDATADFPALGGLAGAIGRLDVVLDGEVVAFDAEGRPSFAALQQRAKAPTDIRYVIFDVLEIGGESTCTLAWHERRGLLEQLDIATSATWQITPVQIGAGDALVTATRAQGLEGVIAKRLDSRYEPGRRSGAWRKFKHWGRQEFVVGGWTPGKGARSGGVGSLLLGVHDDDGRLRYAGRVGTGFTDGELGRIGALLAQRASSTSPFDAAPAVAAEAGRAARYVRPDLVVEVAFAEWSGSGIIRQASYKGLRFDKDASAVVCE